MKACAILATALAGSFEDIKSDQLFIGFVLATLVVLFVYFLAMMLYLNADHVGSSYGVNPSGENPSGER